MQLNTPHADRENSEVKSSSLQLLNYGKRRNKLYHPNGDNTFGRAYDVISAGAQAGSQAFSKH
eukprot:1302772-Amphidinium_carterae.1